ncbi:hypothetical protein BVH03_25340 [Pseudomonas sp. PA15(2017)]|uniref:hypothetical protein n=1 Tax=Pseudomonas sp. PA15(2017) TaxID=1932111 RepID=UPI00095BEC42|nr:hypothetical protein [Pseudomonas sp. PA15(2017)]OLU22207.1 hypothetical protein BVH03_25340 [Pseudomonas sp. PA15(2017)]
MIFEYNEKYGVSLLAGVRDRARVRDLMGGDFRVLPKTEFSENTIDVFGSLVARTWYDASDILIGIEFYALGSEFYFSGVQVLGKDFQYIERFLSALGIAFDVEEDGTGISINDGVLRFYIPDMLESGPVAEIKSVYVDFKL